MDFELNQHKSHAAGGANSTAADVCDSNARSSKDDLVLDMSGIEYVEASFLKSILRLARNLEGTSRHVVIQNPEPKVARTLLLAGFLHLSDAIDLKHTV